jgi:sugar phosphate permease
MTLQTSDLRLQTSDLASAVAKTRRRLVPLLFLLYIFAYLDRINVGFAALQMNEALGFSATTYAFGAGIFFVGYVLFEIPSNVILARVGARLWIARIMITWGLVSAGTMFVRTPAMFHALRFLLGLAEAGFFPGIIFYLTQWIPASERAETIAGFMTAVVVAGIIGGPISGALLTLDGVAGLAGWQWLFVLEGIPSVIAGCAVLSMLPNRPQDAVWLSNSEKKALQATLDEEHAAAERPLSTRAALTNGRVWLLGLAYFFSVPVALYAFGFFLPQIIQASFHGSSVAIGVLSALPYVAGAIAMVVVGRHSDRTGERRWHVFVSALVCAAGFVATAAVRGIVPSMLWLTIAMAALASIFGPFWTLASGFMRGVGAAAGIALVNAVGNIGGFVGPYLLGSIKDHTNSFAPGLVAIGSMVAVGGALVLALPDPERPRVP